MPSRLLITVFLLAAYGSAADRVPVSQERVLAALKLAHLAVEKSQVHLLSEVSSKSPSAALQVEDVARWNVSDALIKVRCAQSGQCLPFFVRLHWTTATDRDLALGAVKNNRSVRSGARRELLVRAGQKATMVNAGGRFHASTPVLCMEAGSEGQKVRVATLDRKRFALAEVVQNGLLKGSF